MRIKKTHWRPTNLQMKISAIIKYKILNKAITKSLQPNVDKEIFFL